MPVYELIVLRNPARRTLPASVEARLAARTAAAGRRAASAATAAASSSSASPATFLTPRANELRAKAAKNELRAAEARARVVARENAARAALERRSEVAAELARKQLDSKVNKARDATSRVKEVRLRASKAEVAAREAREKALAAELARGAALHLAAVEERRCKAHAANQRVATVHSATLEASELSAKALRDAIDERERHATEKRTRRITASLASNVRALFRFDAAVARKNLSESLEAETAKSALEASLQHAAELREKALEAVKAKAHREVAKVEDAVHGAKAALELRTADLQQNIEQRLDAAEKRRTAYLAKLVATGEKLSTCGNFVIDAEGGWRTIVTPPASPDNQSKQLAMA